MYIGKGETKVNVSNSGEKIA